MASAERPWVLIQIRQPGEARLWGRYTLSGIRESRIRFGPTTEKGMLQSQQFK